jgi:hypothetical protein
MPCPNDDRECRFKDQTKHGYSCVDIATPFCELGSGCIDECPFSYEPHDEHLAIEAFNKKYPNIP